MRHHSVVAAAAVLCLALAIAAPGTPAEPGIRVAAGELEGRSGFEGLAGIVQQAMVGLQDEVELTVVQESLTARSWNGFVTVSGEVRNDGDRTVSVLSLQAVALDASGALLDAVWTSLPASSPAEPWNAPINLVPPGTTTFFSVTLRASADAVATTLVRVYGVEVDLVPGDVALELVGDWEVREMPPLVELSGRVRNPTAGSVAGLGVTVVAREPSGAVLAVGRIYPRASVIGGYRGGLRAGEELDVALTLAVDPAELDTASLETWITGRPYGGGIFRYGVVGLAHSPGAGGSVWRSSLTLTNRSGAPAGVALRYQHAGGQAEASLDLDDGESHHQDDVVRTLFGVGGSSAGYLQIASSAPLTVTARTSNETTAGGFGQALPVYTPEMTMDLMGGGTLAGLRGGERFRSNIGLVNMAATDCVCRVRLFDPSGDLLWERAAAEVGPTAWRQLNDVMPADAAGASAEVDPGPGCWVWAYASVIEEASGDPTTIAVEPAAVIDLTPYPYGRPGGIAGSWADQDVPEPPRP